MFYGKTAVFKNRKDFKKIQENRKLKGFSQEYMASVLEISVSAYNKLERNETTLSVERLLSITNILEIPLSEMLEIKTGENSNQDLKDFSVEKMLTLYQENKDKTKKIEELYYDLLKEKDETIIVLKNLLYKK